MSKRAGARRGARRAPARRMPRLARPPRLLTPLGRGVLATAVVATGLAVWLSWHEFTQLAVAAFGLLLVALVWQVLPGALSGTLSLRQHRTVVGAPPPVAVLEVEAGAAPMLFPRVVVPVGPAAVRLRLPFLRPFARHQEVVEVPDLPRGVHTVGTVTYQKTDPVGLMTRSHRLGDELDLLVSPQVCDLAVFAGGMTSDLDGATSRQLSMSDLAFHALREYAVGDDLRHVHWRSSAKAGQLLVRQFHETRRGHVTVLVDASRASYPREHDFELAVSAATSIALRAVRDDLDTYLRCGPHLARSRHPVAMTDVACRFALHDGDDHVACAAEAAEAGVGSGLVVQVTGAARDLVDLDAAAARFGRGADWLVVRADSATEASARDSGALRELVVPDLAGLRALLARGIR
ncbi:DUF58 domain-containing protein [Nocardioides sp. zg-1228]|uniref:DUF58 domain-containing protein n=1 Tax=Nocardioides sp. zg-1228 TaxID=2763008 RepID=UPI00164357AD|nr:DUF58 domain-containing protein [Nocardioides sp. zg-1228]MBC2934440.1 DUF58 domain-containing protein [Nocardioides sp. zg-1228]QSF59204.1 DUF58 domain-containing protein [Nocardioides sp. zg-1228]